MNTVLVFVGGTKAELLRAIESADDIADALRSAAVETPPTKSSVAVRPAGAPPVAADPHSAAEDRSSVAERRVGTSPVPDDREGGAS